MWKYIIKRMVLAILTLFIILFFSYILIVTFISNPYEKAIVGASTAKQRQLLQEAADNFNKTSVLEKINIYFSNFFHGDFGRIYIMKTTAKNIPDLFFGPLKWTMLISLPSFILSAFLGVILGILGGYNRGKVLDSIINIFVSVFIAIPSFILAPYFINLFTKFGFSTHFISPNDTGATWWTTIKSIIPPIVVVTLGSLAVYTLYSRNQVVSVLTSNYVLIAKTKGLSGLQIFRKYVFRNISIPLAAIIIPSYIILLSGSIIIERFWSVPGSSSIIAQAFPSGEINVVMFNIFFFTALSLGTEVFVDVSYALIDPRIKYQEGRGINYFNLFKAYLARRKEEKELIKKGTINA